ncbi:MAG: tetratricopeptide repeat protein [Nitrospiraceae bacterium]|nr:tetratricopeptide repeat protein [Nitrospiraceae bacterium]
MGRVLCGIMWIAAVAAAEPSFNTQLERGHAALRAGDADGAIAAYRDLQTDDPESDVLYYSIGRAQYEQGVQNKEAGASEDAITAFQEAAKTFEAVATAADPELRKRAAYNHANCIAQIAEQSAAAQQYDETVAAFEQSVQEYEELLRKYPGYAAARNNLDHTRFLLKSMLQNPPPPQEQQQQGEDGEEQKGEQDQEQQQQQGGDQQKGEQDQEQQQQQGGDQQKGDEEQQDEQSADEQQQQQGDEPEEEQGTDEQQAGAQGEPGEDQIQNPQEGEGKKMERQNVEALLESLEDIDEREQRETKNVRRDIQMRKDWW